MGVYQLWLNRKRNSIGPNYALRLWVTVVWLGQAVGPLAVGAGLIPTACTGFFGTHSLWRNTLLSLNIVSRTLVLPQTNVPYPLRRVDGRWCVGKLEGTGGEEGVKTGIGMENEKR